MIQPRAGLMMMMMLVALGAAAGAWAWRGAEAQRQRERGQAIFEGRVDTQAKLVGHAQALPVQATQCVNCHAMRDKPLAGAAQAASGNGAGVLFAVALDHDGLTRARSRRGGPASVFDRASLCRLVREGVDPAEILVPTTMPRYALTDGQCADLWAYLETR